MLQTCLDRQSVEDFVLGRLPQDEQREVALHVEGCSGCQSALAASDEAADSLVRSLRTPAARDDEAAEPHFALAAERVKRFSFAERRAEDPSAGRESGLDEPTQLRDYRLLRKLGEGGMGTVYKALHTRLDRVVALKVLPPDRMHDDHAVARFQQEMRAVGKFDHPAVVRATDAGDLDGTHFLVMEYVEGLDLSELVRRAGSLPIADACELIRQAAAGLEHVHQAGLVHRDIKPSNLMLSVVRGPWSVVDGQPAAGPAASSQRTTDNGQRTSIKILDLGLALLAGPATSLYELTTVGQFMGTLDYTAPEQADDSHEVDARADVYSLGATLYKLLTGTAPFAGGEFHTPLKKLKALLLAPPPDVREKRDDVPAELAAVLQKALAKDPGARFASAAELAAALKPFAAGCDLPKLVERAGYEADADGRSIEAARVAGPPLVQENRAGFCESGSGLAEAGSVPGKRRRWFKRLAAVLLPLILLLAGAYVIRVQTDRGELVIKSSDPNVQVLIKRNGEPVDDWELKQGENRTTVRSGEYDVVLIGRTDGLTVQNGTFTLTRGGEQVVTIERKPRDHAGATTAGARLTEPTYDGIPFSEWVRLLKSERKPEKAAQAMLALAALADEPRAKQAASLILKEAEKYGNALTDGLGGTGEGLVRNAAVHSLQSIDSPGGVSAFIDFLENGTTNGRACALYALSRDPVSMWFGEGDRVRTGRVISIKHARRALPAILKASRDEHPRVRRFALDLAVKIDKTAAGLEQRLREALRDADIHVVGTAALELAEINPKAEGLVEQLIRLIRQKDPRQIDWQLRGAAIKALARLGSKAAPAVPLLVEIVRDEISGAYHYPDREFFGVGGSGGDPLGPGGNMVPEESKPIRVLAVEALGAIGPAAKEAVPAIREAMKYTNTTKAAREALEKIGAGRDSTEPDRAARPERR